MPRNVKSALYIAISNPYVYEHVHVHVVEDLLGQVNRECEKICFIWYAQHL